MAVYRFNNGAQLYTTPKGGCSVVPGWAPTQFAVSISREAAAIVLRTHKPKRVK